MGDLNNLSFPELTTIGGGFLVANNTELEAVDQFPKLKTIAGALDFRGVFENVTFPALGDVRGGANVESSTQDDTLCNAFNRASDRGIIKGKTSCKVNEANSQTNGSSTSSGGSSSSSSDWSQRHHCCHSVHLKSNGYYGCYLLGDRLD